MVSKEQEMDAIIAGAHHKMCLRALQKIALLADTKSKEHMETFQPEGPNGTPTGWRVAEAMREVANDVVGALPLFRPTRFSVLDRVRVREGIFSSAAGQYGTITYIGGDVGDYYGVKLDGEEKEMGFAEDELENACPDEPAWVSRFAQGRADCSPFAAQQIAEQVRELLLFKKAMESMAAQFIHPKMTAKDLAEAQLQGLQVRVRKG